MQARANASTSTTGAGQLSAGAGASFLEVCIEADHQSNPTANNAPKTTPEAKPKAERVSLHITLDIATSTGSSGDGAIDSYAGFTACYRILHTRKISGHLSFSSASGHQLVQ